MFPRQTTARRRESVVGAPGEAMDPQRVIFDRCRGLFLLAHCRFHVESGPLPEPALSRADEAVHPTYPRPSGHPRNARVMPKSRDFH